MTHELIHDRSKSIHLAFVTGSLGLVLGAAIMGLACDQFTKRGQVLNYPQTKIYSATTYVVNGKSITKTTVIPARIVPDSLLQNIQP